MTFQLLGAFGIVHKGELVESDGSIAPIAIKTIKCESFDPSRMAIFVTCSL